MALFEKHGMENIGYWTPIDNQSNTLVYVLAFKDKEDRERAWQGFLNDPDWQDAFAKSIEDGRLVAKIDSTLMRLTDYSPSVKKEKKDSERVFELRRYRASAGNLAALDSRFRDHTMKLFEKHGMTNLFYFHIAEGEEGADDMLLYFLAHPSVEARDAAFAAFGSDPVWQAARKASEKEAGGSLTAPGGVTSQMLAPTDYSPIQ